MEYFEAVNYVAALEQSRPKLGTETTARLLDALGNPHEGVEYVQIAGSNGKGSTAVMLDSILRSTGLSVGRYTSPDLNDLRERIRVDERTIPKDRFATLVERIQPAVAERAAADDEPTKFEVLTALSLAYFGESDVDVTILEVGIGGRYDATSVVDPVASAVTAVCLEHTELLGDTVEVIARDKAQVAPADRPLVTGTTGAALAAVREETDVLTVGFNDADVVVDSDGLASRCRESVSIESRALHVETSISLLGRHQAVNAGIAAALARQVADADRETIARGLELAAWPGRFEVMPADPFVVLDGAHNPDACAKLATLVERFDYEALHLVFGALADKDHDAMIGNLPRLDAVTICRPDVDRAADPAVLAQAFDRTTDASTEVVPTPLDAVDRAIRRAGPDDAVLVTGSLYTVAEVRDRWTRPVIPKRTPTEASVRRALSNSDVPTDRAASFAVEATHRTITTYCRPAEAERVADHMRSVGGTAAVSAIEGVHQHVAIVLNGSSADFDRLCDRLDASGGESARLAARIRSTLEPTASEPRGEFPWDGDPAIMGILNVTPDSFHDGGEHATREAALSRATRLIEAGADVLDVGGESTRPGATPVSATTEIERILPVVERLADRPVPVSVDTRKPAVAEAAIDAGADVINDVSGLTDPAMRRVIAEYDVPVVAMHSRNVPVDPDRTVPYDDVVEDVIADLGERLLLAERSGIDRDRIVVDPGIGFGKTPAESFELIDRLDELRALGRPILVGHSHKSMFDAVGCGPDRLAPTVATTALATARGADLVRVHDVAQNLAATRVATSMSDRA